MIKIIVVVIIIIENNTIKSNLKKYIKFDYSYVYIINNFILLDLDFIYSDNY